MANHGVVPDDLPRAKFTRQPKKSPVNVPQSARRPPVVLTDERWVGARWEDVARLVDTRTVLCQERLLAHDRMASRWRTVATPLAWLTAVSAALSGLTVIADIAVLAVILSIATAVLAASNAALNPSETARDHRTAALGYQRLRLKLDDIVSFEIKDWATFPTAEEVKQMRARLKEVDDAIESIAEASPPIRGRAFGLPLAPEWFDEAAKGQ